MKLRTHWINSFMNDTVIYLMLGGLALVPLLRIALTKLMQPTRIKFARAGHVLLLQPDVTDIDRRVINYLLDDAYNWRHALALAFLAVPVGSVVIISRALGTEQSYQKTPFTKLDRLEGGVEFKELYRSCMLGSAPIASIIAFLQIIPLVIVLTLGLRSLRRAKRLVESQIVGYFATAARL